MNWKKEGHIFSPTGESNWMYNYAAQVSPIEFNDFIRIYFTTRSKITNNNYETRITFLDCDKTDPSKILYIHDKPLLELGQPGTFDEHGTMMSDIVFFQNTYYLYYLGWQRSNTVPYITTLGLATSKDGINFKKISEGPVIGLNMFSPFGIAKTSILIENNEFNMWYTHYNSWAKINDEYRPTYDIRFAKSSDGINWIFSDKVCIFPKHENEALGAPAVKKINNSYHMWYGYRDNFKKGERYKMGYAISNNKIDWNRLDTKNIINSSNYGWDSEMVCYPNILISDNLAIMFYSGNGYGKEGFGYATLTL